jgi:hypothetical protein
MNRHGHVLPRTKYTPNEFNINGDTVEIVLYEGECTPVAKAIVDLADLELVKQHKWHRALRKGKTYVETFIKQRGLFLHHLILPAVKGMDVDHKDGDGFNNRRGNLRYLTHHANILNKRPPNNKSGRMGVYWREARNCWVAMIFVKGKRRGKHYKTLEEAIHAREDMERLYVGTTVNELRAGMIE